MNLATLAKSPASFRTLLLIPGARGPARLGDVAAEHQQRDFTALDPAFLAQARGVRPECGRYWLERTKGASKDSDLAVMLLWLLAFSPRPITAQAGAVDQGQADELRKAAKGILRLNPWLGQLVQVQTWCLMNPHTDSRCEIVAADVGGSHGARPDVLILNELSHVGKEDFAMNLLDNASKVPHGLVVVATNAGLNPSWQWDLREMARTSARWYFSAFTEPAPWLDAAELQEARKRNSPLRYARLWQGQWVRGLGDALSGADIEAAVVLAEPWTGLAAYYGGLDLGISRDHAALCALALANARVRLADLRSWAPPLKGLFGGKIDLARVEAAVLETHRRVRFRKVFFDPYQAELMAQNLTRAGVPMEAVPFTAANLSMMATALLERFHSRTVELYRHPQLLSDLHALKLVDKGTSYRLEATRNSQGHGDRGTAFLLALLAAERYPAVAWDGVGITVGPHPTSPAGVFGTGYRLADKHRCGDGDDDEMGRGGFPAW